MSEPKRPKATRTEQWEWTATMDGHRATATSEQGAKYGALCAAYDHLEAELTQLRTERDQMQKALMGIEGFCYGLPAESFGHSAYRVAHAALTQREGGEE